MRDRARAGVVTAVAAMMLLATVGCTRESTGVASGPSTSQAPATPVDETTPDESASSEPPPDKSASTDPVTSAPSATGCAAWSDTRLIGNARYGFSIELPSCLICEESANGDGKTCVLGDVQVLVFGSNGVPPEFPGPSPKATAEELTEEGWVLTYTAGDESAFTVSGVKGDQIIYVRYLVGSGSCVGLQWTYPLEQKSTMDDPVTHSVRTLQPGDLSVGH